MVNKNKKGTKNEKFLRKCTESKLNFFNTPFISITIVIAFAAKYKRF